MSMLDEVIVEAQKVSDYYSDHPEPPKTSKWTQRAWDAYYTEALLISLHVILEVAKIEHATKEPKP